MTNHSQAGQVGLIILLISAVVLSIGLAIASRTVNQAQQVFQREGVSRIFSAVEFGVEEGLAQIFVAESEGKLDKLNTEKQQLSFNEQTSVEMLINPSTNLETSINQGMATELELNGTAGDIDIFWSKTGCAQNPGAILVSLYQGTPTTQVSYYGYDGCTANRESYLEPPSNSKEKTGYFFHQLLAIPAGTSKVKIMPLYANTELFVQGSNINLAQYNIVAQAQESVENSQVKSISVSRTVATNPVFMDFALVSGQDIIK